MRKIAAIIVVVALIAVGVLLDQNAQLGQIHKPAPYPAQYAASEEARGVLAPLVKETEGDSSYDRKVIMSSSITLEVGDFQKAYEEVATIVARFNGFIADSHSYETDQGQKRGTIVLRMPQEEFLSAINELEDIGYVKSKRITGKDVTEEYVDLEARLKNLERQESRLLDILAKANTVDEILKVEKQLERVRGEIERMTGRMRYLDDRVELATISLELYEPEPIKPAPTSWGVKDALRKSLRGFVDTTNAIIVTLGTLLPVVLMASVGYIVYRLIRRTTAQSAKGVV
jgi:hypothetical protein